MILILIRGLNLVKIIVGYLLSRITGKTIHFGNPVAVSIEPTNCCNLHCPECPAGMQKLTRTKGFMQPELFHSIIDQLYPHLSYLTLYFQGEPYLNRHIFDFITLSRSKNIFVATSTNGHFLDELSVRQTIESGLNQLIISLDGTDQENYEIYRKGGNFSKVISGIRLLVNEKKRLKKKTPQIILQCLILRSNEHRLRAIRKLGKEVGVDKITFKTAQFYDYENGNPLMPETQKYSRYKEINELKIQNSKLKTSAHQHISTSSHYRIKNPHRNSCFRMWSSCVVTWDGKVVPCCFDKDARHLLGDLEKNSFNEIWRNKTYDEFRMQILKDRRSVGICNNCFQTF